MQLARVIGTVVASIKNESLAGRKLLIVQTLNKDLEPTGKPMVAVDSVGAGFGELVFWCRGKEASFPFKREDTPTDCTIVGIVDSNEHVTQGKRSMGRPR
jgi:ethanolamine utilization protein EutN